VLSDRIVVEVTVRPGDSFLDRMIRLVEGAERQPTPNEVALGALLAALTLVFLVVCATLPFLSAAVGASPIGATELVALFVCLIPTTIGGLLPAIGIAGMDRALRANVLAKSGKAVEVAGDMDVLLLDKTGTITLGARQATQFLPLPGVPEACCAEAAALASLEDPTPEGRSIVDLARRGGSSRRCPPALPSCRSPRARGCRARTCPGGVRSCARERPSARWPAQGGRPCRPSPPPVGRGRARRRHPAHRRRRPARARAWWR
jgi:K+-transporting ATPase ATPase B chain